ncbi:LOW QUALITY PROTEIN: protein bicaudal C homolog 1-B-like [Limulus polyphemus]|uniref:LOW QUALITY PROTEIN: protein bicaudal C homolog 1-B-like n=1 Tax=Limulus polyphemus TaxID=6850 RepID=A0ABM1BE40_LIMPO|nr:LOW QUALITY PROTEIN: protein bicaudal C homolog 1-B-like [Limulus polyphemus]
MRLAGEEQSTVISTDSLGSFAYHVPGLQEERFRVDRRKLEQMLQGTASDGGPRTAEYFFQKIMEETDTQVSWPTKLKIGAKSKKDPHIKIYGRPEAVTLARERILEVLDTKKNRVTLKMDVSYTDHSHIIGKGGNNIQQVMDETGCHIHFPDSNRNGQAEKSNQVSIAGQATEAEKARCRIRELLPLVFSFQLPLTGLQAPPDPGSQALLTLQQKYGFTMSVRQWSRSNSITIVLRGYRKDFNRIRQGFVELVEYLTGTNMPGLPVTFSLEISSHHHSFIMGHNGCNVHSIIQFTGASITFPDTNTSSGEGGLTPTQSNKSTVTITGQLDCVYVAWQELMGCLPLVLMFDLKDSQNVEPVVIQHLMEQLKVNITLRPKPKQNWKSVIVRGAEKDSRVLFEVRRHLLGLDRSDVPLCCEKHAISLFMSSLSLNGANVPQDQLVREVNKMASGSIGDVMLPTRNSVFLLNNSHLPLSFASSNALPNTTPQFCTLLSLFTHLLQNIRAPASTYNHLPPPASQPYPNSIEMTKRGNWSFVIDPKPPFSTDTEFSGSNSSRSSSISSPNISPRQSPIHSICSEFSNKLGTADDRNVLISDKGKPYGWDKQPCFPGTTGCPRPISGRGLSMNKESSLGLSMAGGTGGPSLSRTVSTSLLANGPFHHYKSVSDHKNGCDPKAVGCERVLKNDFPFGYEEGMFLATKAMQRPVSAEARVPTSVWSGQGFSKSTPEYLFRNKLRECRKRDDFETLKEEQYDFSSEWGFNHKDLASVQNFKLMEQNHHFQDEDSLFCNSNYFDSVYPKEPVSLLEEVKDLPELFCKLGLMKYTDLFLQNEIDLGIFLRLTDKDLQNLGIPYSPKLKMLKAISEMANQTTAMEKQRGFSVNQGVELHSLLSRLDRQRPSPRVGD